MSNGPYANPYAPPRAASGPSPAWDPHGGTPGRIEGDALVMPNGAPLPPVCLKCAARGPLESRHAKFSFVPPWARILGPLIQLIVMKRSKFDLPLCAPCNSRWRTWTLYSALSMLPGFAFIGIGMATDVSALYVVGFVVLLAALVTVLLIRKRHIVFPSKIDKTHTWLKGAHPEAMRAAAG